MTGLPDEPIARAGHRPGALKRSPRCGLGGLALVAVPVAGVGHVPLDPADQREGVVRMAALIVTSTVTPHRSATLGTAIAGPPDRYGASCLRPAPRERGEQGAQHPAPNLSRATPGRLDGWHDDSMGSVPAGARPWLR
jgi:hypothetical protein